MRNKLADYGWIAINPMLPNRPRGVPRANDRRVPNRIFRVLRSGTARKAKAGHAGAHFCAAHGTHRESMRPPKA